MKTQILNALKTTYANLGLSDKAFDGVASFLEKTVTKEDEIDGVIKKEDVKNLLKAFQGESDSLRNRAAQLQKDFDAYKVSHPEKTEEKPDEPDEEPAYVKALREQNAAIIARLDKSEKEAKAKGLLAEIVSESKKKLTHEKAFRLTEREFSVQDDETKEAAIARFEEAYNANKKEFFSDGVIPPFGSGNHPDGEEAFKDRLKAFADSKFGEEKKD